ncbi:M20/M25/M40 family metallo-hydrolase [Sporolactobacillus shoreicorticis]|uniref:M20/M25/M40 family metallo-hydrolase n=1 Tax=Sporolactobacillus shoreicorticis TaxID=1923877 RepID=A0ABW5S1C7_9BACL|nr:M20/M25/M40 family metallo-hydrolase [Sporolactobacillus shoreicorticis]MCO7126536.1 M20/M25/M40 family metallo-hydrolase [Sporolactobacillus shoreicorticis]
MSAGKRKELEKIVHIQAERSIETLCSYLRLPSVSAQNSAIPETVHFVTELFHDLGAEVNVLDDLGGNPVVYAFLPAGEKGNAEKTLLFYNHYDVQPPEPFDEWDSEPFEPLLKEGTLYARGVADDKGALMQRIVAVKVLAQTGSLPCNIKFIVEGEEEVGSPGLPAYLEKYANLFRADACIWEFGEKDAAERVQLFSGVKGSAYFEMSTKSSEIDIHSSLAAVIDNPAWRLVQALASMKNQNNDITVEGFFDEIEQADDTLMETVRSIPFEKQALVDTFGLSRPLITEARGEGARDALMLHPTLTICGMVSGYTGEGAKTVLPKEAKAKIDCRMVPGQTGEHLLKCFKRHLTRHGFSDIKIELIESQRAFFSDIHDPFLNLVKETAEQAYQGEAVLNPTSPGTGPMYVFHQHLQLPIVSTGAGWAQSRVHAPNESIRIKDYIDGSLHMAYLLIDFAK